MALQVALRILQLYDKLQSNVYNYYGSPCLIRHIIIIFYSILLLHVYYTMRDIYY